MVKENKFYYFVILFITAGFILNSLSVIAVHIVTTPAGAITMAINEDVTNLFNISINNTDVNTNITNVTAFLYGNFNYNLNSQGTSNAEGNYSFENTSTTLTWINATHEVVLQGVNSTYFWFNITANTPGTYNITIVTVNSSTAYRTNFTVTVNDTTVPNKTDFASPTPAAYSNLSQNFIPANITAWDNYNITAIRIYLYYSNGTLFNNTNVSAVGETVASGFINFTNLSNGVYHLNATAIDNNTNQNLTGPTRVITLDTTLPSPINLVSPANSSNWTSSSTVTFTYDVTDAGIANCSLIINNAIDQTNNSITVSTSQTFTKSMSNANYNWSINCTDYAGNINFSETRVLTVNYSSSSSSSGSSGGSSTSFWINTQSITEKQFTNGYTAALAKKYRVQVTVAKKFHYIGIIDLSLTTATINVSSTSQQSIFNIGDEKKFEVTNDTYYDVYVKLNSISNSKANITIKSINEKIPVSAPVTAPANVTAPASSSTNETTSAGNEDLKKDNYIWIIAILIPVVIIGVIIVLYLTFKPKSRKKVNEKIKVFY